MYDSSYSGSVKVIHAADLHLDSPFLGLERYEGAPVEELVGATRAAFVNLVDFALNEEVSLVLLAGDIYDGDWPDYNTGLFFAAQLKRLQDANVRVVIVSGNHDAASVISKHLRLPANATVLSHAKPQVVTFDDLGIAVTGQSFGSREVTDDLSQAFPNRVEGLFNFALLHTSADGRPGHERYAPCKPAELALRGYDYWALGHVHNREIVAETPWIVFSGSLQGRHAREIGAKGFFLIEIESNVVASVTPVDVDVVRWDVITLDLADAVTIDDVTAAFAESATQALSGAEGRLVAARVVLLGATPAHAALVRDPDGLRAQLCEAAIEVADSRLWIEKIQIKTSAPTRVTQLVGRDESTTDLIAALRDTDKDVELAALVETLTPLRAKLPIDLRTTDDGMDVGGAEHVASLIPQIEALLRLELSQPETAP